MTDKEQIEEMAKMMVDSNNKEVADALSLLFVRLAEALYNADYRKQSEGEWIKHPASYECTVCKEEFFVEGYAEDYDPIEDWELRYCPHCGAKMKGGE